MSLDTRTLTAAHARAWSEGFIAAVRRGDEELTELDRRAGDGDFGANMRFALRRAAALLDGDPPASVGGVFTALSEGFLQTGGTSGPLFGMWFREFAKATGAAGEEVTAAVLARAATAAVATVQRLGKAEVGHKTMVDAMAPAAGALRTAADRNADVTEALRRAAAAAREGAESTRDLVAVRGRASYVGEHARGVVDPGALTVALFFEAAPAFETAPGQDS
jgi:dihydroxyacetone kinase-like protein